MANICCFRMSVKGDKSNISKFTSALTQDGEVWMGRGAEADIDFLSDSEAEIEGCCKWSIQSALIGDSFSMRRQKETGEGYWGDLDTSKGFISLFEAYEILARREPTTNELHAIINHLVEKLYPYEHDN